MNKQDSYQFLLLTAINQFNLKDSIQNVRLRQYDVSSDLMLMTYTNKRDFTLGQLKINASQQYILEIKTTDEEFKEF